MQILLVTPRPEAWTESLPVFKAAGVELHHVETLDAGKAVIRSAAPELVILDTNLEGEELRRAIVAILMINASVHTAVVSDSPEELFHEETEGLGIMMPIPNPPSAGNAERILQKLAALQ